MQRRGAEGPLGGGLAGCRKEAALPAQGLPAAGMDPGTRELRAQPAWPGRAEAAARELVTGSRVLGAQLRDNGEGCGVNSAWNLSHGKVFLFVYVGGT